jgi:hypothetical protein
MKKLIALAVVVGLAGCAEKKPLTQEEQWHGYCTSIGNASRSIMLDRQNGIEKAKAVEHANKLEDETTKKFIFQIIEEAYAISDADAKKDVEGIREQLKEKYIKQCISTPHDKMPEYKPF